MVKYMKCPRCELNYIDSEKQEYCDICLKEMKGIALDIDDMEDESSEEVLTEICPVCGENMMRSGEKMCDACKRKAEFDEEPDPDQDEEWRNYIDDDTDLELDEETAQIDETFDEEFEEEEEPEEEYASEEEDDFEYVTGDDIYDLGDDEDEEEDPDDEDDF